MQSAILFVEFKGFTLMATDLAEGTESLGITPARVRASGITLIDGVIQSSFEVAMPKEFEHLGGDSWAFVFSSLEDGINFGCILLRQFQNLATNKAIFFLKPSVALGLGEPKWKKGRPLDDMSISTYITADKGIPYHFILIGDAIDASKQYPWVKLGDSYVNPRVQLPLKCIDWQAFTPPKVLKTDSIDVSIPPLLLDSEIMFSSTTDDAIYRLSQQQIRSKEIIAFGGPVPFNLPAYRTYLHDAIKKLREDNDFRLSVLTYIPRSEALYGYAWLKLTRQLSIECAGRFAPAVFLLQGDQLRPISYHIYDEDFVYIGLRSFVPQRGIETMSASVMFRNFQIAEKLRAEFMQNWQRFGPLNDTRYAELIDQIGEINDRDKKEAMKAVSELLAS